MTLDQMIALGHEWCQMMGYNVVKIARSSADLPNEGWNDSWFRDGVVMILDPENVIVPRGSAGSRPIPPLMQRLRPHGYKASLLYGRVHGVSVCIWPI